jgi:hypothetical protein
MRKVFILLGALILIAIVGFVYVQYFSDKNPRVVLLNPAEARMFVPGETVTIEWELKNFKHLEAVDIDQMNIAIGVIDADKFGGTGIAKYMIEKDTPVQGEHTVFWTIPDDAKPGQYRFAIDYYRLGGRGPHQSRLTALGFNSPIPFTIVVSDN